MKKLKLPTKIKNLLPLIFIFIVWFIFASPYFIKGSIPYPSRYQVSFFPPWNAYQEFAGPVKNNAISDVVNQMYPWKHFTIEEIKKGRLPVWNPYSFSGNPHLANYQSAVLSPFNLLFLIFPFMDAWSLLILLQPLVAGLGMWLFLRELNISSPGRLIGSISFMFCGFIVAWMPWGTLSMVAAFLPWSLFAIEKGYKKSSIPIHLLLSLSLTFALFSGHFQIGLYVALYSFAYLVFKGLVGKNKGLLLKQLIFYAIGIALSLVQILPALELYQFSVRSQLFTNNAGGIPFTYLVTLFAPDFYGNPVTRNDWLGFYGERASFIGIIPFLLAVYAMFSVKNRAMALFFFVAGLVSIILSLDSPLQNAISLTKIPVFSTSIPSRIIILFSFSFAVLAAIGFDYLIEIAEKRKLKNVVLPFGIIGVLLLVVWALLFLNAIPADKAILAKRNLILPSMLFSSSLVALLVTLFFKKKFFIPLFSCLLIFFVVFDSLRFVTKWMPFDPKELVYPQMPVITALQKEIGHGRVFGDFGSFIDTYYNLPSVNGYDPLYSRRYGEFIESVTSGEWTPARKSLVSLSTRGKYTDRVLDLLGVNIIYHPISNTEKSWAYPVWEDQKKYSLVYSDGKFQLFRNNTVLPRAKIFYKYIVKNNDKEIIKTFYKDDFDFRETLVLEEDPQINHRNGKLMGEAKIISYTPNRIVIQVNTDAPALLFLSDTYYPSWRVKVNGKGDKIYRADYAFRSVKVPGGMSEVEFYLDDFFFF